MTGRTHSEEDSRRYPAIGSLATVGDGRSLALIASDGNIEWFCPVRFDAPPLVWPLLDRERGGRLRVGPRDNVDTAMRYVDESAVVECDWWTEGGGHARATLCMEWPPGDRQQRLLWVVRGLSGSMDIDVDLEPRFDFGRTPGRWSPCDHAVVFEAEEVRLAFQAPCAWRRTAAGMRGRTRVAAGEEACFCLSASPIAKPGQPAPLASIGHRIETTLAAWRDWSTAIDYVGRFRENIVRSAITLKLLIHEPTGAVVAAGTTSLPEEIGGVRNWDYRYTWFRDAGLTLSALFSLGCRREAHRWAEWMQDTIMRHGVPLRALYDVDGKRPPAESEVANVEGYRGSLPVRVGNAAAMQFQLDIYGEALQCVFICDTMDDDAMRAHWPHIRLAADYIAAHWHEADSGIWEVRSAPRHFVHSKATAWAGLHYALWLQRRHGLEGAHETWAREAHALRQDVLRRGISRHGNRFIRSYGEDEVDASLLLVTRAGFVDGTSELFRNTVAAVRTQLGAGAGDRIEGLLNRYITDGRDGLRGGEGAFAICSFWLVEALAMSGRRDEAEDLFERLLALQGDLGLYAEQIDPLSGEQLGNFPQAFTHVGLINAALRLQGHLGPDYPFSLARE